MIDKPDCCSHFARLLPMSYRCRYRPLGICTWKLGWVEWLCLVRRERMSLMACAACRPTAATSLIGLSESRKRPTSPVLVGMSAVAQWIGIINIVLQARVNGMCSFLYWPSHQLAHWAVWSMIGRTVNRMDRSWLVEEIIYHDAGFVVKRLEVLVSIICDDVIQLQT